MGTRFDDSFWGTEFVATFGFDTLMERMKDAKHMLEEFQSYVRQRAQIEEQYGKAMVKLAKSINVTAEIGTLRAAWDTMHNETEAIGMVHVRLAQQLTDEVEKPAKDFKDKQRDQRKRSEDTVRKAQKYKAEKYEKNIKSKKAYETRCREADKMDEEVSKSGALPPKKLDEVKARQRKARQAAEQADVLYQEAVKQLDEARVLWEHAMEKCCASFQNLEEERIAYLRSAMWFTCNLHSAACVLDDEKLENYRVVLEKCSVEADILEFIHMKMTGFERPSPIEYDNFYHNDISGHPALSSSEAALPTQPTFKPSTGSVASMTSEKSEKSLTSQTSTPSLSYTPSSATPSSATSTSTPTASTPTSAPQLTKLPPAVFVRAAFDYSAQGPQELSLKTGDLIRVITKDDSTWWCGELNGKTGMFPSSYVDAPDTTA